MSDKFKVVDIELNVLSEVEADKADAVMCMPYTSPLLNPTNSVGQCANKCGTLIQWHNSSPKKPRKLCIPCAQAEAAEQDSGIEMSISQKQADHIKDFLKKRQH